MPWGPGLQRLIYICVCVCVRVCVAADDCLCADAKRARSHAQPEHLNQHQQRIDPTSAPRQSPPSSPPPNHPHHHHRQHPTHPSHTKECCSQPPRHTLTRMPISKQCSMVSLVSWRGGSKRGTRPAGIARTTCVSLSLVRGTNKHVRCCTRFRISSCANCLCTAVWATCCVRPDQHALLASTCTETHERAAPCAHPCMPPFPFPPPHTLPRTHSPTSSHFVPEEPSP